MAETPGRGDLHRERKIGGSSKIAKAMGFGGFVCCRQQTGVNNLKVLLLGSQNRLPHYRPTPWEQAPPNRKSA